MRPLQQQLQEPGPAPHARQRATAEIVHRAVPGRVRFRHAGLIAQGELAQAVAASLPSLAGVVSARANPLTGSVLIHYAPPATIPRLAERIDDLIAGRVPRTAHIMPHAVAKLALPVESWHAETPREAAERLGGDLLAGLKADSIRTRLNLHGPNEIKRLEPRSIPAIFAEQMTSLPIALLGASACLSLLTGGIADAVMIAAVVLLNAGIATATERQAEHTILGLSRYAPKPVPAIRDGAKIIVPPAELVPGDLILLARGTLIAADARLVASDDLTVNESALTGEAFAVHKEAGLALPEDTPLAERRNMVFRSTVVTGGSGAALVTATGMTTEIGRVQQLLGAVEAPETPIQRQLGEVERELIIVNGLICGAILGLGLTRGQPLIPLLRSAISLAVAAIPEGLPAVATTALALGIQDMRKRNVFVRKIDAIETLGAVEVLGLDKTGTLTENRMAAAAVHVGGASLTLEKGSLRSGAAGTADGAELILRRLLEVTALCSDAVLKPIDGGYIVEGTPTESALIEAALANGIDVAGLRLKARVLATAPRGDRRKRMSTLHATASGPLLCVKGDPLEVLTRSARYRTVAGIAPLDPETRAVVLDANQRMAGRALRVLGVAMAEADGDPHAERDLVWLGLVGLANPIRPSVVPALRQLRRAGIRTVMITGDQSATAFAIARELDLANGGELKVLEAGQITGLQSDLLAALVGKPQVFARVNPVDKLNIVKALQTDGHIVAMTGDGINDGPALRAADIGISMGGEGTDVAREVADIVLASDDLEGMIEAIRLGRATYANIRKVLRYLVSTNAAETFAMLGTAVTGAGEAMTPMQLLWLNLISDPLPALALALEAPEEDVLEQPPHDPRAPILATGDFRQILREGLVMGTAALAGYFFAGGGADGARGGTIAFHGLTFAQLLHALASRSQTRGLAAEFSRKPNPVLYGTLAASAAIQAGAQLFPLSRRLLNLAPLRSGDVLAIAAIAAGSTIANDVASYLLRDKAAPPLKTARRA
jgi:Ca2+-transporting ATPase